MTEEKDLEARVVALESLLKDSHNHNTVLNEAVSSLVRRTNELEQTVKDLRDQISKNHNPVRRPKPVSKPSSPPTGRRTPPAGRRTPPTGRKTPPPGRPITPSVKPKKPVGIRPANKKRITSKEPPKKPTNVPKKPATKPSKPSRRPAKKPVATKPIKKPTQKPSTPHIPKTPVIDSPHADIDQTRKVTYQVGKIKQHVYSPSWYEESKNDKNPPESSLELDYIYGYNGKVYRDNVQFVNDDSAVAYHVAGTGVIYDFETRQQRFFLNHNEDVTCLAVSPVANIAATGQSDPKGPETPYICVWDTSTLEEKARIEDPERIERSVTCLAFSADGDILYCVDDTDSHEITAWKWKGAAPKLISSNRVSQAPVFGIAVNRHFKSKPDDEKHAHLDEFVTLGKNHIKFWKLQRRDNDTIDLISKSVSTMKVTKESPKTTLSAEFMDNGVCVVGTATGHYYLIKDGELIQVGEAHNVSIGAIAISARGFVTAGFDGMLKFWDVDDNDDDDDNMECKLSSELQLPIAEKCGPKAITSNELGTEFVVGTKSNELFHIKDDSKIACLMQGHLDDVWGLAVHPSKPLFITAGNDGFMRVWDYENRTSQPDYTKVYLKTPKGDVKDIQIMSAAYSNTGKYLALGFKGGKVVILDGETFEQRFNKNLCDEEVSFLAFSPSDSLLAIGSWDQLVHTVTINKGEFKVGRSMKGHSSSITSFHFSEDGQILATTSKDYALLYFDVKTGRRLPWVDPDMQWFRYQTLIGWHVKGIFGFREGTYVNTVDQLGQLCVTGDDGHQVSLFRFPALHADACREYPNGHSSFVCTARFTSDGAYVITTGGHDYGVFQWKVVKSDADVNPLRSPHVGGQRKQDPSPDYGSAIDFDSTSVSPELSGAEASSDPPELEEDIPPLEQDNFASSQANSGEIGIG